MVEEKRSADLKYRPNCVSLLDVDQYIMCMSACRSMCHPERDVSSGGRCHVAGGVIDLYHQSPDHQSQHRFQRRRKQIGPLPRPPGRRFGRGPRAGSSARAANWPSHGAGAKRLRHHREFTSAWNWLRCARRLLATTAAFAACAACDSSMQLWI